MAMCYFVGAALRHPAGGFLFCFLFAKTSFKLSFYSNAGASAKCTKAGFVFPMPCSCKPRLFFIRSQKNLSCFSKKKSMQELLAWGEATKTLLSVGTSEGGEHE